MPKPPSTWKSVERKLMEMLGWVRTHWKSEDGSDPTYQEYSAEVKHGDQVPKWLTRAWEQARDNSEGKTPVLFIHPTRWRYEDTMVVVSMSTFMELIGVDDER